MLRYSDFRFRNISACPLPFWQSGPLRSTGPAEPINQLAGCYLRISTEQLQPQEAFISSRVMLSNFAEGGYVLPLVTFWQSRQSRFRTEFLGRICQHSPRLAVTSDKLRGTPDSRRDIMTHHKRPTHYSVTHVSSSIKFFYFIHPDLCVLHHIVLGNSINCFASFSFIVATMHSLLGLLCWECFSCIRISRECGFS